MILTTLKRTTWDKIKPGEVFAYHSCWCIFYKISNKRYLLIDTDYRGNNYNTSFDFLIGATYTKDSLYFSGLKYSHKLLYKLSEDTQRLWRVD